MQEQPEATEDPQPTDQPVEQPPAEAGAKDVHMWGMLCHLSALAAVVLPTLGQIIGPLVIWLIKRNESPFIDQQGKAALNFQISITIYLCIAGLLCLVVIGFVLFPLIVIFDLVMIIKASVKASDGESFQYPLTIKFLK